MKYIAERQPCSVTGCRIEVFGSSVTILPLDLAKRFWSSLISLSKLVQSGIMRMAAESLGSFVKGLLHKSIVFAAAFSLSEHHVSHQSHSLGRDLIGT